MSKAGFILSSAAVTVLLGTIAVMAANGTLTALVSSFVASPSVDRPQTPAIAAAPVEQPEVEPSAAIEAVPAPAPTAPISNDSSSVADTAPVLNETSNVPSAAGGRVTGGEILVPDGARGRTALTEAEKAAVARGLKELGITAPNSSPSSPTEQAATADLNRKVLADSAAQQARAKQVRAQYEEQVRQQKSQWEKQQQDYLAQRKSAGTDP